METVLECIAVGPGVHAFKEVSHESLLELGMAGFGGIEVRRKAYGALFTPFNKAGLCLCYSVCSFGSRTMTVCDRRSNAEVSGLTQGIAAGCSSQSICFGSLKLGAFMFEGLNSVLNGSMLVFQSLRPEHPLALRCLDHVA